MSDKLGIGIVGFGRWPREAYIPAIQALDEVEVIAVAARSDATIQAARDAFSADVRGYRNYHDLLNEPRVEAVLVAAPNAVHAEVATWALKAGKHVFLEPPFAESPDQASAFFEEAGTLLETGTGRPVFQGNLELGYAPVVRRLRRLMADRMLGDLVSVHVRLWCDWGRGGSFQTDEAERIGVFVHLAPWYFQLLDVLLPQPARRVSTAIVRAMNGPVVDHGTATVEYESERGLLGRWDFHLFAVEGQETTVHAVGTEGEAWVDVGEGTLRWRTTATDGWQVERVPPLEPVAAFAGMRESVQGFVRAIRHEEGVPADLASCRRIHQLCYAAQQSADNGTPVELTSSEGPEDE